MINWATLRTKGEVGLSDAGQTSTARTQAHGPRIERTGWIPCAQSAQNPPNLVAPGASAGIGEDFVGGMTKIFPNPGSRLNGRAFILDTGPPRGVGMATGASLLTCPFVSVTLLTCPFVSVTFSALRKAFGRRQRQQRHTHEGPRGGVPGRAGEGGW